MAFPGSLKTAERRVFQATIADGLWDFFLGCFILSFAVAPLLSTRLGDFWSSAIMIPVCGLAFLLVWILRKNIVQPRIGTVTFGAERNRKLRRATLWLLALNIVMFVAGLIVSFVVLPHSGLDSLSSIVPNVMGLLPWILLSITGYLLEYPRLYLYGALLMIAPLVGEWLYREHGFSHHGIPIAYGTLAGIMVLIGMGLFIHLLRSNPPLEIEETDG